MKRHLLFLVLMVTVFELNAQHKPTPNVTSIAEIIFPASANIRNNFNLFYEIHLNREEIPQPSFWYKITFNKKCTFKFNLFPLIETDKYDFFLFKIRGNQAFCDALNEKKLEICYAEREHRIYSNQEQSTEFRANLIHVKPIEVETGDAIYLEVFSVKGNDCGHILDFQTDESSFVVKLINDNCTSNDFQTKKDTIETLQLIKKEQAFSFFQELLCNPKNKSTTISSIKLNNAKVEVKNQLDLKTHVKNQPITPVLATPVQTAINKDTTPTKYTEPLLNTKQPLTVIDPPHQPKKSTADLNNLSETQRNVTRLEVDYVLFNILNKELHQKIDDKKKKQQQLYEELRNTSKNKKEKRTILNDELRNVKQQKIDLANKQKEVSNKLKQINQLLAKQYTKNKVSDNDFVFNKGAENTNTNMLGFAKSVFVEGLVYRIQVGVYKNAISETIFKGISPIYGESFSEGIRYSVGSFSRIIDAKEAKSYVIEKGLTDAFVVAYYNGKKLPTTEAIKLEEIIKQNN